LTDRDYITVSIPIYTTQRDSGTTPSAPLKSDENFCSAKKTDFRTN